MPRKITAPNIISGTHGKVWWDGSVLYELQASRRHWTLIREVCYIFRGKWVKIAS